MQVAAKKSWELKIVRSTLVRGLLGPDQATSRDFVGRSAFIDKPGAPSITLRYAYVRIRISNRKQLHHGEDRDIITHHHEGNGIVIMS